MDNIQKLIVIFFIIIALIGIYKYIEKKEPANTTMKIIIYQNGKKIIIDSTSPVFSDLRSEIENLTISADNRIWDPVFSKTIYNIKENETGIELIYSQPKQFQVSFDNQSVVTNRILIPLSGKYNKNDSTVIFFGNPYESNPYINSKKTKKLKMLVESLY